MARASIAPWSALFESGDGSALLKELSQCDSSAFDNLQKYFETLSTTKALQIWTNLLPDVNVLVSFLVHNPSDSNAILEHVHLLKGCIRALRLFLSNNKERPQPLRIMLLKLNSLLGDFDDESDTSNTMKNDLSLLCEYFISTMEIGYEDLLPVTITFLLRETLKAEAKESTVKRLFAMRTGFDLVDFSSAGTSFQRDLLLRCFVQPIYIKSADGRKLLAEFLTLSNGSQILASQYGTIFYRSWKEQSSKNESFIQTLEECIQDFVHEAIHCNDAKRFKGLRYLVKSFHDINRSDQFNAFLVEVFDPIIWRSLSCANAIVRTQAAVVFLDVFPLQRQSSNSEESDHLLQKQFDQLVSLLKDEDHRVRAVAVTGVCHILCEYWEMLPPGSIHNILKYLFETLAFDASSANVRYAVVMGVQELLQQPAAHRSLKTLLPLLRNYIHDKSDKVRIAFIHLLVAIKSVQGIVFYEIVPLPHLLARLADDRHNKDVVLSMTELLLNSYFPSTTEDKFEKVNRCLEFVQDNYLAAEAFYCQLHTFASVGAIAKLAAMLFSLLLVKPTPTTSKKTATDTSSSNNKRRRGGGKKIPALVAVSVLDDSNVESQEREGSSSSSTSTIPSIPDPVNFLRILKLAGAMLDSIRTSLANHASSLDLLVKYLTAQNLSQLIDVVMGQESYQEHIAAGLLHLISVLGKIITTLLPTNSSHRRALEKVFNLEMLVERIYLVVLPSVKSERGSKLLAESLCVALTAWHQELYLIDEVRLTITTFDDSLYKKVSTTTITLDQASSIMSALVDSHCQSLSQNMSEQVIQRLGGVWETIKTSIEHVLLLPKSPAKKVRHQPGAEELHSLVTLAKAWLVFTAFNTSSTAISSLLPDRTQDAVDLSLSQALSWWLDLNSRIDTTDEDDWALTLFRAELACELAVILSDTFDLLPLSAIQPEMVEALCSSITIIGEVLEDTDSEHSLLQEFAKAVLTVCHRLTKHWSVLQNHLSKDSMGSLSTAADSFLSAVAGRVAAEDAVLHSMYQRCVKIICKDTSSEDVVNKVTNSEKGQLAATEKVAVQDENRLVN
eukprot:scaffold2208_cov170-Ochromonas_danica.AAC.10